MTATNPLFLLIQSFFGEHLQKVRGASRHTIAAYRDTLKLFLQFLADNRGVPVDRLTTDDLRAEQVSAFLQHLEQDRGNRISTRNCRRIALRSFFQHALRRDPLRADHYARALAVPAKRTAPPIPRYLEPHHMRLLLGQPDRKTLKGQRDHALLLFLYNTGARVSEAVAVRQRDFQFVPPYHVRLLGKGSKERFCPLWLETTKAIQSLLATTADSAAPVFIGPMRTALTRHGANYILAKHAATAARADPTFLKRVSPHMLRHSCACALLQAGVDLTVIRDYLGHASITTTSRYANSNLKLKRDALTKFWERSGLAPPNTAPWKPTKSLLSYLAAL